jgi:hypothetical protein
MELLETQDPEKKRLLETSDQHRRELEREVNQIAARGERVLKNALIIGGTLAITYLLVTQLTRKNSSSAKAQQVDAEPQPILTPEFEEPTLLAKVGSKVANAATLMLLEMAREKLTDYFKNRNSEA